MSDQGEPRGGGFDWEGAEDITALSEDEPSERPGRLVEQERALSYRRRVLQGRIDLIRAEHVQRARSFARLRSWCVR